MFKWVYAYILIISILAWGAMGVDKYLAVRQKYRISESFLLLLALVGGGVGTMAGMIQFKHKTNKPKFRVFAPLGAFLVGLAMAIITYC